MNQELFKNKFHPSWYELLLPFFSTKEADEIFAYLKKTTKAGNTVIPKSQNTFNSFLATRLDNLKLVIIGGPPDPTIVNGVQVANGINMSCENTGVITPTLDYFYYALQNSFSALDIQPNCSLEMFTNQGVLFLNSSLSVEENNAMAHLKLQPDEFATPNLWWSFYKYLFEEVLIQYAHVPVILMGKSAIDLKSLIPKFNQRIFETEHPSVHAKKLNKNWDADKVFQRAEMAMKKSTGYFVHWGLPRKIYRTEQDEVDEHMAEILESESLPF